MVDDVGRIGVGREQRREDLGVQPPARRCRNARADRVARELVAEADVRVVHLEQLPAFGLLGRHGPVRHDDVEDGGSNAAGHDRNELDQVAIRALQARCPAENGVRDGPRDPLRRRGADELVDVERVAAGRGEDLGRPVAGQRGDRALRQRPELEHDGVVGPDRADGGVKRVARRNLAGAEGQDEQRRKRPDPAPEHGDRVERCVVGPVDILEHEDRRPGRQLELGYEQRLDVVRRGAGGQGSLECRRHAAREVADRAERPRDGQIVTGAEESPGVAAEPAHEPCDQ